MEIVRVEYRTYRRPFRPPVETAHGPWLAREGIVVRVEAADGRTGFGEVAPIEDFGTESLEVAEAFLASLVKTPHAAAGPVPEALPCCAFALSSAVYELGSGTTGTIGRSWPVAALLPAGEAALKVLPERVGEGFTTFKWKIGVGPGEAERSLLGRLVALLPRGAKIRLDANGGLDVSQLAAWVGAVDPVRASVDFLEQPLPAGSEAAMRSVADDSGIAVALDESLNGPEGRAWLEPGAWPGPLVVKPALMGERSELVRRLRRVAGQVVVSSAFETAVGLRAVLSVSLDCALVNRPLGINTSSYFNDGLSHLSSEPLLHPDGPGGPGPLDVWNRLPHLS